MSSVLYTILAVFSVNYRMINLKTGRQVGIIGYGAYVPMYRLMASEINRVWGGSGAPVEEKSVVAIDEDTITISVEAAKQAVRRAKIDPSEIGAVYVGTESKPYAVKPSGTIVAEVIGATPSVSTADFEFACKAGTEAMQPCMMLVWRCYTAVVHSFTFPLTISYL